MYKSSCAQWSEVAIVQHRKFLIPILAVLLVGVVAPLSVQRAHGDDYSTTLNVTGVLAKGYTDQYLGGTYNVIQAGNTINFNVFFTANYIVFQRNLTMGVKFDWMQNYQNTTSPVTVLAYGTTTVTLAFQLPQLSGANANLNQAPHSWTLEMWDMGLASTWTAGCSDPGSVKAPACIQWSSNAYSYYPCYNNCLQIAIYSSQQATYYNNMLQAGAIIGALSTVLGGTNPPAGSSAAAADMAQATTQALLAQNAYRTGDFNTAQSDSQNALNDANAAQSSLGTIGGGTDAATMTSIWLTGAAVIMGGIGALLLGFGGFKYMRGKTRSMPNYTPPTPAKS